MHPRVAVGLIAFAELLGTSLWFAANGVAGSLAQVWTIDAVAIGHLTSSVQLGFITGTLLLALSGLADRFSPSRIFFVASLFGAASNLLFALPGITLQTALVLRFLTGIALAGIYPLGMKLVVQWAPEAAGRALSWLVGMLVLGTSLPHLMQAVAFDANWRFTIATASALAVAGGVVVLIVGNGPGSLQRSAFNWGGVLRAFRQPRFRAAAGGYFGHMWELYALWALAPYLVAQVLDADVASSPVSFGAFAFIATGAAGCVAGGMISTHAGSARTGFAALLVSGCLCVAYPLLLISGINVPLPVLVVMLFVWSAAAVADSPQFSALVAAHAPADAVGSSLAIVNGIGFLVTVVSISLLMPLWQVHAAGAILLLAPGPFIGLLLLRPLLRVRKTSLDTNRGQR